MSAIKQRNDFFQKLWDNYKKETPVAQKIEKLLLTREEQIFNDHIAFRTLKAPGANLDCLADLFLSLGYKRRGEYFFEKKKLKACHLEVPEDEMAPKVFISELLVDQLSEKSHEVLKRCAVRMQEAPSLESFFATRPWPADYEEYEFLSQESEYASWFYAHGYKANHFTVNVNELNSFDSLQELNEFLEDHGILLNSSGGKIKGAPREHLEQSSTMADSTWVEFEQGPRLVPSCYYEFARRYEDSSGQLFQGFVTGSADKIFESTHRH